VTLLVVRASQAESPSRAQVQAIRNWVSQNTPNLAELYRHLHTHPEVSYRATNGRSPGRDTEKSGFEVTSQVGGHGIVPLLNNAQRPTVMLRTDLDALPVAEKKGLL
jgi:hippurate hydrolase